MYISCGDPLYCLPQDCLPVSISEVGNPEGNLSCATRWTNLQMMQLAPPISQIWKTVKVSAPGGQYLTTLPEAQQRTQAIESISITWVISAAKKNANSVIKKIQYPGYVVPLAMFSCQFLSQHIFSVSIRMTDLRPPQKIVSQTLFFIFWHYS